MANAPAQPGAYRLEKKGAVIYVGSTVNLSERYDQWRTDPENDCVKRTGWDNFVYRATTSEAEARALECEWYKAYNPPCNEVAPPGCK